jgi:hypothetical protein
LGRHSSRDQVFADQRGHRTRRVTLLIRSATLVLLAGLAAVGLSLISGVSLPGLTGPARPPADERPVRNADPTGISKIDTPTWSPALPLPATGGPGGPPRTTSATPTTSATTGGSPTPAPTATPSPTPASTHANRPTTTGSHGHPHGTPPGRTKHP